MAYYDAARRSGRRAALLTNMEGPTTQDPEDDIPGPSPGPSPEPSPEPLPPAPTPGPPEGPLPPSPTPATDEPGPELITPSPMPSSDFPEDFPIGVPGVQDPLDPYPGPPGGPSGPSPLTVDEAIAAARAEYARTHHAGQANWPLYNPIAGFDTDRLNDLNDNELKYVYGRYAADHPNLKGTALRDAFANDPKIKALFPQLQTDKADLLRANPNDPWQDVVYDVGGANGLQFFNAAGQRQNASGGWEWGDSGAGSGASMTNALAGGPATGTLAPGIQALFDRYNQMLEAIRAQNEQMMTARRDALMRLMAQGSEPVDVNDPKTLGPAVTAFRNERNRGAQRQREQLAERAAFMGLNQGGQGSGAFESGLQGIQEDAANDVAGYAGKTAMTELQNRRQLLVQAAQIADAIGARNESQQLQSMLAQIDAQMRQQQMTMGQGQFEDHLAFLYAQLLAQANRDAFLNG